MGQKRTQNIIDEKIGAYLANFEQEVLAKIDRQLTARLDTLAKKEDQFGRDIREMREIARDLGRTYGNFQRHITVYLVGLSLVSSMIGGVITFLFLWHFW